MSSITSSKGSCLCGAVHVSAKTMSNKVGACHCSMCQKWAGGSLMMVDCGSDVSFQDKENVAVFNSSEWADVDFVSSAAVICFIDWVVMQSSVKAVK